ncbi:MAG: 3-deoxy-D-manno-octulosonic acid transferase [Pseudomonadota bacterium]
MDIKQPFLLKLYRGAMHLGAPLLHLMLLFRRWRGKEDARRIDERRGFASALRPPGPLIWVHAASVGETLAVLQLISKLTSAGFEILLTTVTRTSAALAEQRKGEHVTHQYVPVDQPQWLAHFLDHWQPQLAFFAEQELWPNTLAELEARNIPKILLNARLSDRSFRRWKRIPKIGQWLLTRFDLIIAQSELDEKRLTRLGAQNIFNVGNLKFDAEAPPARALDVTTLSALMKGRPVWAAASTHEGEEEQILAQIVQLKLIYPTLVTLIAPRHPQRADKIVQLASLYGLKVAQRSLSQWPQSSVDVFLLDTIGELGLIYRIADIVFMGGSLIPHGGQNPIEPAQLNCALLYGPHVDNFTEIYNSLSAAGSAQCVRDAKDLRSSLRSLLDHPDEVKIMGVRARDAVSRLGGALDKTLRLIEPFLVKARQP